MSSVLIEAGSVHLNPPGLLKQEACDLVSLASPVTCNTCVSAKVEDIHANTYKLKVRVYPAEQIQKKFDSPLSFLQVQSEVQKLGCSAFGAPRQLEVFL